MDTYWAVLGERWLYWVDTIGFHWNGNTGRLKSLPRKQYDNGQTPNGRREEDGTAMAGRPLRMCRRVAELEERAESLCDDLTRIMPEHYRDCDATGARGPIADAWTGAREAMLTAFDELELLCSLLRGRAMKNRPADLSPGHPAYGDDVAALHSVDVPA